MDSTGGEWVTNNVVWGIWGKFCVHISVLLSASVERIASQKLNESALNAILLGIFIRFIYVYLCHAIGTTITRSVEFQEAAATSPVWGITPSTCLHSELTSLGLQHGACLWLPFFEWAGEQAIPDVKLSGTWIGRKFSEPDRRLT